MENSTANKKIFDIRERTLKFSVSIIQLVGLLPKNAAGFAIANQVVRSGMSKRFHSWFDNFIKRGS